MAKKTRYKDADNERIYVGDVVSVKDNAYSFDGVVEERNGEVYVTYYDYCSEKSFPLGYFLKKGRHVLDENKRKEYWWLTLGGEAPEYLYKRELYSDYNKERSLVREKLCILNEN